MQIVVQGFVALALSLLLGRYVSRQPEQYGVALAVAAILGGGLMLGPGYALLDEALLLAITLGLLTAGGLAWPPVAAVLRNSLRDPLAWAPLALFAYLLLSASITALQVNDWRLLRWSLLYAALLMGVLLLRSGANYRGDLLRVSARAGLLWFGAWAMHWLILEYFLHVRWEDMQAISWSGSTYAALPAVVVLPAALLLLDSPDGRDRGLGWGLVTLIGICAQLYSSRILIITLLAVIAIALLQLSWRRTLVLALLALSAQLGGLWANHFVHLLPRAPSISSAAWDAGRMSLQGAAAVLPMVGQSVRFTTHPRPSDADRHDHLACAMHFLAMEKGAALVLGYGQDRHKQALLTCPEMKPYLTSGQSRMRSTAFTAFVYNHGLLGLVLLTACVVSGLWRLLRGVAWKVTVPFYCLALAWGLVTDYRDHLLIWLVIAFDLLLLRPVRCEQTVDAQTQHVPRQRGFMHV